MLLPYFKERNEDIPLQEAITISQQASVKVIPTNDVTEPIGDESAQNNPA
jgi:hypothetical protein